MHERDLFKRYWGIGFLVVVALALAVYFIGGKP